MSIALFAPGHGGAVLLAALVSGCAPPSPVASAPSVAVPQAERPAPGPLRILDAYLAQRIAVLEAAAPPLRAAMDAVRAGALPVYIGTPAQVARALGTPAVLGPQMLPGHVGEFASVRDTTGALRVLMVRVDLARLDRLTHRDRGLRFWEGSRQRQARFDALLDAVLIHEIWGHLVPVAQAGGWTGACADPRPGQSDLDACVMRRENELRQRMGLRARRSYALGGDGGW